MRLLLINPNTTASMTEKAAIAARAVAGPGTEIIAATSQMGPASIEGYYDGAIAVPGMLRELKERQATGYDAAIICCFDDTGLEAARMFCTPVGRKASAVGFYRGTNWKRKLGCATDGAN